MIIFLKNSELLHQGPTKFPINEANTEETLLLLLFIITESTKWRFKIGEAVLIYLVTSWIALATYSTFFEVKPAMLIRPSFVR